MKILAETIHLKNVQYRSVLAPDLFSSSALLWAATSTIDLHTGWAATSAIDLHTGYNQNLMQAKKDSLHFVNQIL